MKERDLETLRLLQLAITRLAEGWHEEAMTAAWEAWERLSEREAVK